MTPASSWGLADRWANEPGARGGLQVFKRLLLMPVFSLGGLVLVVDWSWHRWVLVATAVMLAVYTLSSLLMYRAMVAGGDPTHPVELPLEEGGRLVDAARQFGEGIGIDPDAWRLVDESAGVSAVAPMPDRGSHSLVAISEKKSDGQITFGFVRRAETGHFLVSTFLQPLFPFKNADWFFDIEASAYSLWRSHCDLVHPAAAAPSRSISGTRRPRTWPAGPASGGCFVRGAARAGRNGDCYAAIPALRARPIVCPAGN